MLFGEVKRLIMNIVSVGVITRSKSKDGKAFARVQLANRESACLPVVGIGSFFKRHWIPIRVGEQCIVFSPFGDANSGFIIRNLFFKGLEPPEGSNDHTEVIEYEDGTKITYDSQKHELKIVCEGGVRIKAKGGLFCCGDLDVKGTIKQNGVPCCT